MATIEISLPGSGGEDGGDQLGSLARWLRADGPRPGVVISTPGRAPRPGEMGSVTDVVQVVLAPGGAAAAIVTSVYAWLSTRRKPARLHVKRGEYEFDIEAGSAQELQELVKCTIRDLRLGEDDPRPDE